MRRIGLAVVASLSLFLAPLAVWAQTGKTHRIGFLGNSTAALEASLVGAFCEGLRDLGYVEGQNVLIEYRWAEGKYDRFSAAHRGTARHEGLGDRNSRDTRHPRRLPTVSRVAVLTDSFTIDQLRTVETGNRSLGFQLQPLSLRSPPDFEGSVEIAVRSKARVLFVLESPLIYRARKEIAELALKQRLSTSFAFREYVDVGGLVSYGVSFPEMFRLIAEYVDKILKGAKPDDLPVEQPTKFELVINLKTGKALGLTIPPSVLLRTNQVVE